MQPLRETCGSYMPAFFYMKLEFPFYDSPTALFNLSHPNKGSFLHEYIHYLQDVTTFFGLNNAYVYSEYIHQAVNEIYKQPNNEAKLPIRVYGNKSNVELNREINRICTGDYYDILNLFILDISEKEKRTTYLTPYFKELKHIFLKLPGGKTVQFGGRAIMESMAYIIEKRVEPKAEGAPEYPYCSAEYVAKFLYPEFADDLLRGLALCDMSLQCSNPGKVFVQTIKEYKEASFIPTPEQVYDYFYQRPIELMGVESDLLFGLISFAISVGERLVTYLNDADHFMGFHKLIRRMIGMGLEYRMNNRYFFLELARGGDLDHNNTFFKLRKDFGSPLIIDYSRLESLNFNTAEFSNFLAIEQIYKTIAECSTMCGLYELCEQSKQLYPNLCLHEVDDRCIDAPWTRSTDEALCPYAVFWKHWNLHKRKVTV